MADEHPGDPRPAQKKPPQPEEDQPSSQTAHEPRMAQKPDFGESTYRGHGWLAGRVALVTGADSGIGRAVALAFACVSGEILGVTGGKPLA